MSEKRRPLGEPMEIRFNSEKEMREFEEWAFSSEPTEAEKELQKQLDEFRVQQKVVEKLWNLRFGGRRETGKNKRTLELKRSRMGEFTRLKAEGDLVRMTSSGKWVLDKTAGRRPRLKGIKGRIRVKGLNN